MILSKLIPSCIKRKVLDTSSVFSYEKSAGRRYRQCCILYESCRKMYTIFSAVLRQQRKSDVMTSFGHSARSAVYYQAGSPYLNLPNSLCFTHRYWNVLPEGMAHCVNPMTPSMYWLPSTCTIPCQWMEVPSECSNRFFTVTWITSP
jgi:hypothetical protein